MALLANDVVSSRPRKASSPARSTSARARMVALYVLRRSGSANQRSSRSVASKHASESIEVPSSPWIKAPQESPRARSDDDYTIWKKSIHRRYAAQRRAQANAGHLLAAGTAPE